jgi:energy-converting hydrogenase A subunit M
MSDPAGPHIVKTFHEAINILDQSEPAIRDMIETHLMDVAGINKTRVGDAMLTRDELTKKIVALRRHHLKAAFRHLRDNLPSDI